MLKAGRSLKDLGQRRRVSEGCLEESVSGSLCTCSDGAENSEICGHSPTQPFAPLGRFGQAA